MEKALLSILIILCLGIHQRIRVRERLTTRKIESHFPVPGTGEIIKYRGNVYVVKTIERFDADGMLNSVEFWKSEGFLEFKRREFSKLKDFLEEHDLQAKVEFRLINQKLMKINSDTVSYELKDTNRYKIYYFKKDNNKELCVLKL
ncbi:hypothetical protein SNE26_06805 [Mucilaginibacter sp. cycad4]|uniref:hypothetical protein n=1 Tax=Mucilaginibacter sp. cycad4 TaxID=3342096 RepID=UPI002AAA8974|nr:hypothetical protein [Mucilaginibacter gossypii]WPV01479.1 hypothetical protein SNE26_06805 [Mucilaginibacter gossypii]